ncbi:MAG: hypothetical protein ILP18_11165 [Treponema sp.]|nr:hypothetical protein [Treponema sp.]
MKKTKMLAVVLAFLSCAALLESCDYWNEDFYKNGGDSASVASGGSGSSSGSTSSGGSGEFTEISYGAYNPDDSLNRAAFGNEFGTGADLFFACNGNLFDGNPHQGRARAYNLGQQTMLKDGTFQGTWKVQFTFVLNGTTYVGKFRLKSGRNGDDRGDWLMDIYDSSGTTLLCTAERISSSSGNTGGIWNQRRWQ